MPDIPLYHLEFASPNCTGATNFQTPCLAGSSPSPQTALLYPHSHHRSTATVSNAIHSPSRCHARGSSLARRALIAASHILNQVYLQAHSEDFCHICYCRQCNNSLSFFVCRAGCVPLYSVFTLALDKGRHQSLSLPPQPPWVYRTKLDSC